MERLGDFQTEALHEYAAAVVARYGKPDGEARVGSLRIVEEHEPFRTRICVYDQGRKKMDSERFADGDQILRKFEHGPWERRVSRMAHA